MFLKNPIIIIGMHRSGTTMITNMLQKLGLFIGWDIQADYEARFFLQRNEKILNICGGGWDNPNAIDYLIEDKSYFDKLSKILRSDIYSYKFLQFLGPAKYLKFKINRTIDYNWGWKDPRNVFTLPIWCHLFPNAKIIIIYRNGIDVAASLTKRDSRKLPILIDSPNFVSRQIKLIKEMGFSLYLFDKIFFFHEVIDPLKKYNKLRNYSFMKLDKGFDLWHDYNERISKYNDLYKNRLLSIFYEDFLLNPNESLKTILDFCQIESTNHEINRLSKSVRNDRRFAFLKDKELIEFYMKKRDTYWMNKLGYSDII